jgi:hypothetical protein
MCSGSPLVSEFASAYGIYFRYGKNLLLLQLEGIQTMNKASANKRILLSVGMLASSSIAFAFTSSATNDVQVYNGNSGSSDTYAMVLAGLGLVATIVFRRYGKHG